MDIFLTVGLRVLFIYFFFYQGKLRGVRRKKNVFLIAVNSSFFIFFVGDSRVTQTIRIGLQMIKEKGFEKIFVNVFINRYDVLEHSDQLKTKKKKSCLNQKQTS